MLAFLSTYTGQLTSLFCTSQLLKNTDENSFKHFVEHLVGVRENSECKHKQGRLRLKQDQLHISMANHNQRAQI